MTSTGTPSLTEQTAGFVELARPGNVVMAIVGVAIGALVAAGRFEAAPVAWAALATALVTAGGNALNDVVDREIDRTAHPSRPIPSGRVSWRAALLVGAGSFGIALAAGWIVGPDLFLLVLGAEAALVVYEVYLKGFGLVGNVVVGGLVALTFVAGAIAAGSVPAPVGFLAGLSFLANVGREVFKDVQDAAHDRGRRTLAHRLGEPRATWVARVLTLAAVALSPAPYLIGFGGLYYLVPVALADAVFLSAAWTSDPERAQRRSKVAMVLALIAFSLGGLL